MSSPIENLVTSCPQCNSLVGLPSIMSLDAHVRCPVCHHKYSLRSRLPQQIPQLELVVESEDADEERESPVTIDPLAKLEVSEILRKNAKLSRRRRQRRSHRDGEREQTAAGLGQIPDALVGADSGDEASFAEFQAAATSAANDHQQRRGRSSGGASTLEAYSTVAGETAQLQTAGELAAYERQSARRASSRRRSSNSASPKNEQWVEIAKVVAGALLALPVAQLIIWWVLSVDPLRLAPTVAKVVPFVVPGKVLEADPED